MAAPVASRTFSRHRLRQVVAENVSTIVASQASMGCFDSTVACAALALSKTGMERINKIRSSERGEAQPNAVERPPRPLARTVALQDFSGRSDSPRGTEACGFVASTGLPHTRRFFSTIASPHGVACTCPWDPRAAFVAQAFPHSGQVNFAESAGITTTSSRSSACRADFNCDPWPGLALPGRSCFACWQLAHAIRVRGAPLTSARNSIHSEHCNLSTAFAMVAEDHMGADLKKVVRRGS